MNQTTIIREHIARTLSVTKVETIAERVIREDLQLMKASRAAKLLDINEDDFRKLRIPVVTIGQRGKRYRLSDLTAFVAKRTSK